MIHCCEERVQTVECFSKTEGKSVWIVSRYKPTFEKHIQLYKYCVLKLFIPQT